MWRRFVTLALGLASTLGLAAHAQGAPRMIWATCGAGCATLSAQGSGSFREWASGSTWGRLRSGRIAVLDRSANGTRNWSVVGARGHRQADGSTLFVGDDLSFSASTTFTLKIRGVGISLSSFAKGSAHVQGSGSYHLNGGPRRAWTAGGRTLRLRG
jgi:hypothetical protein